MPTIMHTGHNLTTPKGVAVAARPKRTKTTTF